jgi:hypothetical protein
MAPGISDPTAIENQVLSANPFQMPTSRKARLAASDHYGVDMLGHLDSVDTWNDTGALLIGLALIAPILIR